MPSLLWLVLGFGLFLFGLHALSVGMRYGAGPRAPRLLATFTSNRWRGMLTGIAVTGVIQSSSATNVMVIGFVRAGLLDLSAAIAVMLGANVGTTVTSQLLALDFLRLAPAFVAAGVLMNGAAEFVAPRTSARLRHAGGAAIGFGALFIGMDAMRFALEPLADAPLAGQLLARLATNPYASIVAGALFTGVLQSSSMTTGVAMVMMDTDVIGLQSAIGLILGANVGTVVSTLLASVGASTDARRAAVADLAFNVVGVALFVPLLAPFARMAALTAAGGARQVANAHLLFNVVTAVAALPFVRQLADMATRLVPGPSGQE